jgi:anti-sigma factor RsiW
MDRTTSASHPSHDEMLIVRFYGGDVDDSERAHAIELMADCADCADLFADLEAISEASAAMPVPARPRDFTLTEEDAARLRSKRRAWKAIFGLGLRRSLGGSLAALGLAGLMLTSAASLLGQTTNVSLTSLNSAPERLAASNAPNFGAQGAIGVTVASPASASQAIPAAVVASGETKQATPGTVTADGAGDAGGQGASLPGTTLEGSLDPRLAWLVGFATLFAIGLAIAMLPQWLRRRARDG